MLKKAIDNARALGLYQRLKQGFRKPIVAVIRINGNIDSSQLYRFNKSLLSVPKKRVQCVAVVINSAGGAPAQCNVLTQKLKFFSANTKVPVYTFADDAATSGGFYVLAAGDKIFADNASLLGGVGAVTELTSLKKFVESWGVTVFKSTTYKDGSEDVKSDMFDDISEKDIAFHQKIADHTRKQYIEYLEAKLGLRLTIPHEKRAELLYEGDIFSGRSAKEYGILDDIGNSVALIEKYFPDAKVVDCTRLTLGDRTRIVMSKFVNMSFNAVFLKNLLSSKSNRE